MSLSISLLALTLMSSVNLALLNTIVRRWLTSDMILNAKSLSVDLTLSKVSYSISSSKIFLLAEIDSTKLLNVENAISQTKEFS